MCLNKKGLEHGSRPWADSLPIGLDTTCLPCAPAVCLTTREGSSSRAWLQKRAGYQTCCRAGGAQRTHTNRMYCIAKGPALVSVVDVFGSTAQPSLSSPGPVGLSVAMHVKARFPQLSRQSGPAINLVIIRAPALSIRPVCWHLVCPFRLFRKEKKKPLHKCKKN